MRAVRTLHAATVIAVLLFLANGCTIAKISGRGAIPLILNNPPKKVEVIENVKISKMRTFDYTGAFDVSEILSEIMVKSSADAVINLTVTVKQGVPDFFVNLITLGLARATTFEVQGQAVKAPDGIGDLIMPGARTVAEAKEFALLVPYLLRETREEGRFAMIIKEADAQGGPAYKLLSYRL